MSASWRAPAGADRDAGPRVSAGAVGRPAPSISRELPWGWLWLSSAPALQLFHPRWAEAVGARSPLRLFPRHLPSLFPCIFSRLDNNQFKDNAMELLGSVLSVKDCQIQKLR